MLKTFFSFLEFCFLEFLRKTKEFIIMAFPKVSFNYLLLRMLAVPTFYFKMNFFTKIHQFLFFTGGLDCNIKLWDFMKLSEEVNVAEINVSHNPDVKSNSNDFLIRSYATKSSPVLTIHFTRRNLMLAVAMFDS